MKNKKLTIILIILLSIVALFVTIFMINVLTGNIKLSNFHIGEKVSSELVLDEVYDIDLKTLDIKANAADVYIKNSNDNEIRVIIYGNKSKTSVTTESNNINIVSKEKSCSLFCFYQTIAKVEVYLPDDYSGNIKIVNNYGDTEVEKFKRANIDIKEDYGDVKVDKVKKIKIKESAGDVIVGTVNDAEIKNNYGDIRVKKVTNYLNLSNDCGDINVNYININKDSYIKDSYGNIKVGSTNEVYIDAKTDLGDVKVNNNYRKSEITLKIDNDCGDISIEN